MGRILNIRPWSALPERLPVIQKSDPGLVSQIVEMLNPEVDQEYLLALAKEVSHRGRVTFTSHGFSHTTLQPKKADGVVLKALPVNRAEPGYRIVDGERIPIEVQRRGKVAYKASAFPLTTIKLPGERQEVKVKRYKRFTTI